MFKLWPALFRGKQVLWLLWKKIENTPDNYKTSIQEDKSVISSTTLDLEANLPFEIKKTLVNFKKNHSIGKELLALDIPEKIIKTLRERFLIFYSEEILAALNGSFLNSFKDGIVITDKAIYWKTPFMTDINKLAWEDFVKSELSKNLLGVRINGIDVPSISPISGKVMFSLLQEIKSTIISQGSIKPAKNSLPPVSFTNSSRLTDDQVLQLKHESELQFHQKNSSLLWAILFPPILFYIGIKRAPENIQKYLWWGFAFLVIFSVFQDEKPKSSTNKNSSSYSSNVSQSAKETIATMINLNGYLCAEVLSVKQLNVSNKYEVGCVLYRNGSGIRYYIADETTGQVFPQ